MRGAGWCDISILLKLKAMPATYCEIRWGEGRQQRSGERASARAWIIGDPVCPGRGKR